jgi:hypothetical protein
MPPRAAYAGGLPRMDPLPAEAIGTPQGMGAGSVGCPEWSARNRPTGPPGTTRMKTQRVLASTSCSTIRTGPRHPPVPSLPAPGGEDRPCPRSASTPAPRLRASREQTQSNAHLATHWMRSRQLTFRPVALFMCGGGVLRAKVNRDTREQACRTPLPEGSRSCGSISFCRREMADREMRPLRCRGSEHQAHSSR